MRGINGEGRERDHETHMYNFHSMSKINAISGHYFHFSMRDTPNRAPYSKPLVLFLLHAGDVVNGLTFLSIDDENIALVELRYHLTPY